MSSLQWKHHSTRSMLQKYTNYPIYVYRNVWFFSLNVNIMETLRILKSLTFNMQFTETFSLAVDIVGNDSVGSGILQIGLPDAQCAAVTFKQQLDVLGLLNRLVVLVPDDLWFGVTHQDAIQTHS